MTKQGRIADLEAKVAQQREQIATLLEQNARLGVQVRELEARLAKDSHNSGKPPPSVGLKRQLPRTRSLRWASGKPSGGRLGHRGQTLRLQAEPDVVVEHRPTRCAHCQASLDADAPVLVRERRQVHDLPPMRLHMIEHQALHLRCPRCQQISEGVFPAEAPSRAQYGPHVRALAVYLLEEQWVPLGRVQALLSDFFAVQVGRGTLVAWVQQAAAALAPVEEQIKAALRQTPVLHVDETGVRRGSRLAWAHVASTSRLTHYAIHARRGRTATDAIGILPRFHGVSVHDGWASYQTYTACRHALCNVHHLRELTFLEEAAHQAWARDLKDLLRTMQAAAGQARAQGWRQVPEAQRTAFHRRYRALLVAGRAANPPPAAAPGAARPPGAVPRPQSARAPHAGRRPGAGLPRRPDRPLR